MIAREELIGLKVRVKRSACKNQTGIEGKVVDETKNSLVIETLHGEKRVLKKNCTFMFEREDMWKEVKGADILFRSEERTKKVK
jgi:ribonuclease P protein subunit POP4